MLTLRSFSHINYDIMSHGFSPTRLCKEPAVKRLPVVLLFVEFVHEAVPGVGLVYKAISYFGKIDKVYTAAQVAQRIPVSYVQKGGSTIEKVVKVCLWRGGSGGIVLWVGLCSCHVLCMVCI